MAYCRWGSDCNVYIFLNDKNKFECCGCSLIGEFPPFNSPFTCKTAREMIEHLKEHKKKGHKVPDYVIDELESEARAEAKK